MVLVKLHLKHLSLRSVQLLVTKFPEYKILVAAIFCVIVGHVKGGGGGGGGGGKGRFGYVWLILGKDFKISQKIVSQS